MRRDPQFKCHRTCRMCAYYGLKCYYYGEPSRHPRARAMKCDQYENVIAYAKRMGDAFFGNRKEGEND